MNKLLILSTIFLWIGCLPTIPFEFPTNTAVETPNLAIPPNCVSVKDARELDCLLESSGVCIGCTATAANCLPATSRCMVCD